MSEDMVEMTVRVPAHVVEEWRIGRAIVARLDIPDSHRPLEPSAMMEDALRTETGRLKLMHFRRVLADMGHVGETGFFKTSDR